MNWFKLWVKRLVFSLIEDYVENYNLTQSDMELLVEKLLQEARAAANGDSVTLEALDIVDVGLLNAENKLKAAVLAEVSDLANVVEPFFNEFITRANTELENKLGAERFDHLANGTLEVMIARTVVVNQDKIKDLLLAEIKNALGIPEPEPVKSTLPPVDF